MDRAIARLGILETLFLMTAAIAALLAGALTAWFGKVALGWPFRTVWWVSSLLYFLGPATLAWLGSRREDARLREARARRLEDDDSRENGDA